jgi:hypothetical protein
MVRNETLVRFNPPPGISRIWDPGESGLAGLMEATSKLSGAACCWAKPGHSTRRARLEGRIMRLI